MIPTRSFVGRASLRASHVGAKLKSLCGSDFFDSRLIIELQEYIDRSHELSSEQEIDQLLFDVVDGMHNEGGGFFKFSCTREAYFFIRDKVGSMTVGDIVHFHSLLMSLSLDSFRKNNIIVGGDRVRVATYVPPDHNDVLPLMRDWLRYSNRFCGKSVFYIIISVFRFLQIHPFSDGNGRAARLLLFAMMSRWCGFKVAIFEISKRMFSSGGHEMLLSSLDQVRRGDWAGVFGIFKNLAE